MTTANRSVIVQSRASARSSNCASVGLTCPFSMRLSADRDSPVMRSKSRSVSSRSVRFCHSNISIMLIVYHARAKK